MNIFMRKYLFNSVRGVLNLSAMIIIFGSGVGIADPLTTSDLNTVTANDMVSTLLSGGSGISVSNITYTGANNASGLFSGGSGILDSGGQAALNSGIILTSGSASNVIGPNTLPDATKDNGLPGTSTLDALIPSYKTYDASVLQFNFVPTGSKVEFTYVFGSEEYNEYVNSQFNDVFGFFVNGTNYALIPGTTTPVAINTVNCGYSPGATPGANPSNCSYFIDNVGQNNHLNTQLDGITKELTFVAPVNIGAINTMYIGIADAGDPILDSAVFLKGGSFTVCGDPGEPECGTSVPEPSSLLLLGLGIVGLTLLGRNRFKAIRE